MYKQLAYGVKDILINDNIIYISFTDEIKKDCFNISLLEGQLRMKKLISNIFLNQRLVYKKMLSHTFLSISQEEE